MIWVLSLVESFFKILSLAVISTNVSTQIYNRSCDILPGLYLQIPTENHQYASNKTNLPGLVTKSCKSGLDNLKGKPKTVTEGFGKT